MLPFKGLPLETGYHSIQWLCIRVIRASFASGA
jgi:hypothetical protein